jgi:hypothetical protein
MLKRLENTRIQKAAGGKKTGFDDEGMDRLYREAFAWYGLDWAASDPADAARRVRASAIRTQLIEGLDYWYWTGEPLKAEQASLRGVANLADDDPWRRRLRELIWHPNRIELKKLAEDEGTRRQTTAHLDLLANLLIDDDEETATRLLRRAQQEHPGDFWVNFHLAYLLREEAPADSARFLQAALALRPNSPITLVNLASLLYDLCSVETLGGGAYNDI